MSIRKLNKKDHFKLMKYLSNEPEINLFIIGNIENYGYDNKYLNIWGEFDKDNNFEAVILKFYKFIIIHSDRSNYKKQETISILNQHDFDAIAGKFKIIREIEKYMGDLKIASHIYAKLDSNDYLNLNKPANSKLIKVNENNLKEVKKNQFELFEHIKEFNDFESSKKSFINEVISGSKRVYQLEYCNRVVATVSTTSESSQSAMIVGAATHPKFRNKGYATYLIGKLSKDILDENKTVCLFYENPKAGSIYKKLGFKEICRWGVLTK